MAGYSWIGCLISKNLADNLCTLGCRSKLSCGGIRGNFTQYLSTLSQSRSGWITFRVDNLFLAGSQKLKLENFMTHFTPQIEYKICRKIGRAEKLFWIVKCDAIFLLWMHFCVRVPSLSREPRVGLGKNASRNENQEMAHLVWSLITKNKI